MEKVFHGVEMYELHWQQIQASNHTQAYTQTTFHSIQVYDRFHSFRKTSYTLISFPRTIMRTQCLINEHERKKNFFCVIACNFSFRWIGEWFMQYASCGAENACKLMKFFFVRILFTYPTAKQPNDSLLSHSVFLDSTILRHGFSFGSNYTKAGENNNRKKSQMIFSRVSFSFNFHWTFFPLHFLILFSLSFFWKNSISFLWGFSDFLSSPVCFSIEMVVWMNCCGVDDVVCSFWLPRILFTLSHTK